MRDTSQNIRKVPDGGNIVFMKKIIFATGNEGKMKEIREILANEDVEILSMKEAGISLEIQEDGKTFAENAMIKAKAVAAVAPGRKCNCAGRRFGTGSGLPE